MLNTPCSVCLNIVFPSLLVLVLFLINDKAGCDVVFQPSQLFTSGPGASAFLVGDVADTSLIITNVTPFNNTGRLPPPSCVPPSSVAWTLSQERIGKNAMLVRVSLNRSLVLCTNPNETECCTQLLCLRETVRVSACLGDVHQASLLVQAEMYAQLSPVGPVSENKTAIPNQVFQPLGRCPCDLTPKGCDVRCCCDQDCTPDLLRLFASQCFPGPFGGNISPLPDHICSAQSAKNAPDWFPFLCVTSPLENNPFLGLFYHGKTIVISTPTTVPFFLAQQAAAPVPPINYRQGEPVFTTDNQYFTIPQTSILGQCLEKSPVAFLQDFVSACVRTLQSCPTAPELKVAIKDGQGGVIVVSVVDDVTTDFSSFISSPATPESGVSAQVGESQMCMNVVLALSYTFYWRGNSITAISVIQRIANITVSPGALLTTRYSAVFVNGNITAQPNSGNPGYQVGRPVIGAILNSTTGAVNHAPLTLWQPVGNGHCSLADLRPVLYGLNSTSGCLIPVSLRNLNQCVQLRETVRSILKSLVPATLVSMAGKPDFSMPNSWINITTAEMQNSSQTAGGFSGACHAVPAHLHIHVRSQILATTGAVAQKMIQAVELNFKEATWNLECGASEKNPCVNPDLTQIFPVTSSVTFTDVPISAPPMSRFRINFTEFDCDRNDVCWPELAFPLTPYYTGEPYSLSLAKGLILVFLFIAASVLGTPWRQIRQAWGTSLL